ncbi:GNAT family N-acetyltransferase [Sanguibacter antarcticus]|uniref:Lysine N-acyltransferase MbtK n=1 Tax=Sanguibacter antarcticus TaxID=372484 RepID=A0A2A9EA23_9MICO|nr:GNAT family N-acetyltransferase [Sanguibacter antarcticus]PFG35059.1 RimJ/RimL family protein N-acetyltransferase [Sanguibacter antarcticus]
MSLTITIEPVDADRDATTVHAWLRHPASAFWQMQHLAAADVVDYLVAIAADPHQAAWLGRVDGEPTFLVETYDPAHVVLTDVHDALPGDVGMHLLVAPPPVPPAHPVHGLTSAVMAAVVRFLFDELGALRVVVEPDVTNTPITAKNDAAGFRALREVDLPGKRALLSVCTRSDFASSHLGRIHP